MKLLDYGYIDPYNNHVEQFDSLGFAVMFSRLRDDYDPRLRRQWCAMENEIPPVNRIDEIRSELESLQGQRIRVRANMGRSRIVERTGTLVQAHPSLFVVEVDERRGRKARQSYQYVDVLTGTVELYDIDTGERLLNFSSEEE